jgi:hypothetical protein
MTKLSKVLIIGSGPIIGRATVLARRLVRHAAGADDLAQEGVTARAMVLAGGGGAPCAG